MLLLYWVNLFIYLDNDLLLFLLLLSIVFLYFYMLLLIGLGYFGNDLLPLLILLLFNILFNAVLLWLQLMIIAYKNLLLMDFIIEPISNIELDRFL